MCSHNGIRLILPSRRMHRKQRSIGQRRHARSDVLHAVRAYCPHNLRLQSKHQHAFQLHRLKTGGPSELVFDSLLQRTASRR
jgi:hypothetical protein